MKKRREFKAFTGILSSSVREATTKQRANSHIRESNATADSIKFLKFHSVTQSFVQCTYISIYTYIQYRSIFPSFNLTSAAHRQLFYIIFHTSFDRNVKKKMSMMLQNWTVYECTYTHWLYASINFSNIACKQYHGECRQKNMYFRFYFNCNVKSNNILFPFSTNFLFFCFDILTISWREGFFFHFFHRVFI